jgi:hypothetical protein
MVASATETAGKGWSRLSSLAVGIGTITFCAGVALVVLIDRAFGVQDSLWVAIWVCSPVVGALTAGLRPRSAVGWLLLALGVVGVGSQYAYAYTPARPITDLQALVVALDNPLLLLAILVAALLIFVFPSGTLAPGWRRYLVVVGGANYAIVFAASLFTPTLSSDAPYYHNPLSVNALNQPVNIVAHVGIITMVGVLLVVSWDTGRRLLRARGVARQQFKWLAYASFLLFPSILFAIVAPAQWWWSPLPLVVTANALAASIGLSIVRYRLYDIDRVVSRTVAYLIIVGLLGGVYAGSVLLMTSVLPLRGSVSVVIAVLIAVALFAPVRSRARAAVDRRFNRSRYNAQAVVDAFAGRVVEQITLEAITIDLLDAVDQTVQPSHVSLWLR